MDSKIMNDIVDFEMRISSSMDRILKVLEKPKATNHGDTIPEHEVSHFEKIIASLEVEKKETSMKLQSALEAIEVANQKIEHLSASIERERLELTNRNEEIKEITIEMDELKKSRQSQVDEMDSIIAELETLLQNTGEANA